MNALYSGVIQAISMVYRMGCSGALTLLRMQYRWGSAIVRCLPVFALLPLCILAGCASTARSPVVAQTVMTAPAIAGTVVPVPGNFRLTGRISVRDGKQDSAGTIRWQHTRMADDIQLLSPLGQTVARIARGEDGVQLTTTEQLYRADDAESLTGQVLGWRLPLTGLPYWVQATHSPVTASEKDLDAEGRVLAVRQDGWEIVYLTYFSSPRGRDVRPRIMTLSRENLRIKLVADEWEDE